MTDVERVALFNYDKAMEIPRLVFDSFGPYPDQTAVQFYCDAIECALYHSHYEAEVTGK